MRFALIISALMLAGCAHEVVLTPRDGGPAGIGSAPASAGYSGKMSIDLAGKTYRGSWLLMSDPGSVGLGVAQVGGATAIGTAAGLSTSGNGRATLAAADGSTLRCVFRYSEQSSTGLGECVDDSGKLYDMAIS